jgi:hypothetical protein
MATTAALDQLGELLGDLDAAPDEAAVARLADRANALLDTAGLSERELLGLLRDGLAARAAPPAVGQGELLRLLDALRHMVDARLGVEAGVPFAALYVPGFGFMAMVGRGPLCDAQGAIRWFNGDWDAVEAAVAAIRARLALRRVPADDR